ncbi:MAG: hypothetical protein JST12_01785 [Armatimonadetes bacterium]|nr:hypothetical protein [Armatimonadota bacterium]MBS1700367.1 hypothetical protein [Armatimonadota bacterium]MBS1725420.1 hypothetical protein [Armatimonadota bacterium]
MRGIKIALVSAGLMSAISAYAGTFNVTAPTDGKWLGTTNTLSFTGKGASVQVTVKAVVTGPDGSTTLTTTVNPDVNGDFSGTLALTFSTSSAQGDYTIAVTATEPGNTYSPVNLDVHVDTKTPKLLEYSPAQNSFAKGTVPILFKILENNMKEWRITVGGADIPNNTGTTETTLSVNYDSSTLENDGSQNIALTAKDQADNTLSFTIPLTIDRKPPVSTIQFPQNGSPIRPRSDVNIVIDVADQFSGSVDLTGLDVVIQKTDGTFITRAARQSWRDIGNNTWRWTGRLRYRSGLPPIFKVVASALDKAGNVATRQEVTVHPGA